MVIKKYNKDSINKKYKELVLNHLNEYSDINVINIRFNKLLNRFHIKPENYRGIYGEIKIKNDKLGINL